MFNFFKKKKKLSMKRDIEEIKNDSEIQKYFNVRNTLREGDEGEDVKDIQNMLKSIVKVYPDIPKINVDGKYDCRTKNAVDTFQKLIGLKNNGIVYSITFDRLKIIYNNKDKIKSIEKIEF